MSVRERERRQCHFHSSIVISDLWFRHARIKLYNSITQILVMVIMVIMTYALELRHLQFCRTLKCASNIADWWLSILILLSEGNVWFEKIIPSIRETTSIVSHHLTQVVFFNSRFWLGFSSSTDSPLDHASSPNPFLYIDNTYLEKSQSSKKHNSPAFYLFHISSISLKSKIWRIA